ncbi:MAG: 16S rRNA (guanine(527)-N(7))-methyltransferase RsmG [Nitrospirota bacterium]
MIPEKLLKNGLAQMGFPCSEEQVNKFMTFLLELKKWNRVYNLTALKKDEDIIFKHFLDSLLYLKVIPTDRGRGQGSRDKLNNMNGDKENLSLVSRSPRAEPAGLSSLKICDVGTGAGFPGIPIKIQRPEIDITLIEPSRKKTAFLRHIIRILALDKISVLDERIESLGEEYWKIYDIIVSRATFKINDFLKKACPYIKEEGVLVLSKGPGISGEIEKLKNQGSIKKIEGHILSLKSGSTCLTAKRNLLILQCKKIANKPR